MIDRKTRKLSKKLLAQLEYEFLTTNELLARLVEYREALVERMDFVKEMIDD